MAMAWLLALAGRTTASTTGPRSAAQACSLDASLLTMGRLGEPQALTHVRRPGHTAAETLDDLHRPPDELRVRREHAARQVEVVLEADAEVAAEQHRLRQHRHLHPADPEARP